MEKYNGIPDHDFQMSIEKMMKLLHNIKMT